jgi:hypothetical protein
LTGTDWDEIYVHPRTKPHPLHPEGVRMSFKLLPVPLVLLTCILRAETAVQTDWSCGPGIPGPVGAWTDDFWTSSDIRWTEGGSLGLARGVGHNLDGSDHGAFGISSADVEGDGDTDIITVSGSALVWWENLDDQGTEWTAHVVDPSYSGAYGLCSGDIDGDGDADLIDSSALMLTWWENEDGSGGEWTLHTIDPSQNGIACICIDDVNGDGYPDVLGAAMASNAITWWENADGLGTAWIEHTVDGSFGTARSVYCDDMDLDGDRDILGAALGDDTISWWENTDGVGGVWIEHPVDTDVSTPWSACSFDCEGDGDLDVLGASFNGSSIFCWENADGAGTVWTRHTVDSDLFGPNCVIAEDLDGDGLKDVLGTVYYDSRLSWWKNTGSSAFWPENELDSDLDGAYDLAVADVNGDGCTDVLAAGSFDAASWWDMQEYRSHAVLESSILYLGCDPAWGWIDWNADAPSSTSVAFQVRASDDCAQMGEWSSILDIPGSLAGVLADSSSFFQYRVLLSTSDSTATPELADVTIGWDPTGIEGGEEPSALSMEPLQNPAVGFVELRLSLPSLMQVRLDVFDVSGRLVAGVLDGELEPGSHTIQVSDLAPGLYLARLVAGSETLVERLTVIGR